MELKNSNKRPPNKEINLSKTEFFAVSGRTAQAGRWHFTTPLSQCPQTSHSHSSTSLGALQKAHIAMESHFWVLDSNSSKQLPRLSFVVLWTPHCGNWSSLVVTQSSQQIKAPSSPEQAVFIPAFLPPHLLWGTEAQTGAELLTQPLPCSSALLGLPLAQESWRMNQNPPQPPLCTSLEQPLPRMELPAQPCSCLRQPERSWCLKTSSKTP